MRDDYEISTDPTRLNTPRIHRWLSSDAYWALGRSREKQEAAIAGSLNFGLYRVTSGEQVGYARVVTDRVTFAWLCDVYLDPAERGLGVGTEFVGAVRDQLDGWGLKRIMLATHDAHDLYTRLGFRALDRPDRWMIFEPG
ncbi:GNAT family N-acetyltransferase [Streptomyces sp. ST2-7A]|uniref:GNAT family N-acetyltransferase n=1 Tax=Streptomyces sp. ST2-7A TaxID=2907214 RepID=UPI001F383154|nr:GNAT family N-acetyltransferase [Streptomyces sp. ST2-7A]MCE7082577.1 GNAT family N-acetyltransferase [Streptomyces sp. ST2-7A]